MHVMSDIVISNAGASATLSTFMAVSHDSSF